MAVDELTGRVTQALADDERWRVVIRGKNWLCPYCLRIGARDLEPDEAIEDRIARHLGGECEAWRDGQGEAQPMDRLRQTARFVVFKGRVLRWLLEEPRFHLGDDRRRWLCPYCARATDVAMPDRQLDDPGGWGKAPEDDPFLTAAAAHLLRCDVFADGEDGLRPLAELEEARGRGSRSGLRPEQVRARFQDEPSFRLMDQERRWLCPFCAVAQEARLAEGGKPGETFFVALAAHIERCRAFAVLGGRPRPVDELRAKIGADARARQLGKIRAKVERHAVWRVRDQQGGWCCPYCARVQTDLPVPERGAGGERDPGELEAFVELVHAHLSACDDYRRPDAQVRDRAALAAVVEARNVVLDDQRRARAALEHDPLWRVVDGFSSWVCPHCRRIQKPVHVDLGAPPSQKTVEQVVHHLREGCPGFDPPWGPPRATQVQLEDVARAAALKSSGLRDLAAAIDLGRPNERDPDLGRSDPGDRRPSTGSGSVAGESLDEQSWRRIKEDLDAVKVKVERAKQRETSLREARTKQLRLLPGVPELPGLEFARVYRPCDAVGGDFYAFFKAAEAVQAIAIGDIAGHGIEAALLMGLAKKLLEVHGRGCTSAARTLSLANRDIFGDLDEKTFVTVSYGLIDTAARRFTYARAGHDPLVLYNPDRRPALSVLDARGMALGMDPGDVFDQTIQERTIGLLPGDLVVHYTDGVTEAMNPRNEQFGLDRLYQVIEENGRHEAEYVLWKIEKAVEAHRGRQPRTDDVTMVAFKVLE